MRTTILKKIPDPIAFKEKLLFWAQQFREIAWLDSNEYPQHYGSYDVLLAVDAFTAIQTDTKNAFDDLNQYQSQAKDWLFGYLSYDLKNDTEILQSENYDGLELPDLFFFQPKKIILLKGDKVELHYLVMCDDEMESDWSEILTQQIPVTEIADSIQIQQRITKSEYLFKVGKMLEYIHRGDCYEANFCMEFFAENAKINPYQVYKQLNAISEPPFATFFKHNKHYLLSASPERYLRKEGTKIISQPIKGTAKRHTDIAEDNRIKVALAANPKERSENIMIVDLVRNDLSHTAQKGSVQVEELCGIYTFKQVHQMISTVISEVKEGITPVEVIKTTFPMGSMTGAPKIAAMQRIEELEETKRGLYSGAMGYFTPDGDFDFNVVIRSILYNAATQYVSFSVGSAITAAALPEQEYDECLLKAKAMREVLEITTG